MVHATGEVIDLDSDTDYEVPVNPRASAVIDLTTLDTSDEEEAISLHAGGNSDPVSVSVPAPAIPPLNGVEALPNTRIQGPHRSTSASDEASHSDTPPRKPAKRKKRQLNNVDAALVIRATLSPRRDLQARVANDRPINNVNQAGDGDSSISIKKPSFLAKKPLEALRRMTNGGSTAESSAPKLRAGAKAQTTKKRADPISGAVKKKTDVVKKVLNASLESLVPSVRSANKSFANTSEPTPIDTSACFENGESPEFDFNLPPAPASPPRPSSPPNAPFIRPHTPIRNPRYIPYNPTAASRGAGSTSQAEWYVSVPPAGWHSQAAHPYLPPEPPQSPSSITTARPSTSQNGTHPPPAPATSSSPPPIEPHKSRKRNRKIISDDELDDECQPTAPFKKRKYSTDNDDDLELEKSLDGLLQSIVSKTPKVPAEISMAQDDERELFESDEEEIDELVETAPEDEGEPLQEMDWRSNLTLRSPQHERTASTALEEERPGFFEDAAQMDTSAVDNDVEFQLEHHGDTTVEVTDDADGTDPERLADGPPSTAGSSGSAAQGPPPYFDRAERDLKRLLDEFSDVLDYHPEFTRGYRRPNIAPADATWVRLRPFLRRKLELERIKLQKQGIL